MKLPVSVIAEALEPLAVWRISAEDSNRCYGYPRHFDGGAAPSGHAALLSAGNVPPADGDVLYVCAAPPDCSVPGAALIPDRAVDGARIERTLCALFDRMESWEEDLLGCSPDRSGVQRMLEDNAYCPDIMVQVSAINNALNSFNKVLLAEHLKTCVVDDIKAGREDTIEELTETLKKVMR